MSHWVSKSELKSAGLKRENDPCHSENKSERSTVLKADPFISLSFSSEWFVCFFLVSGAWLPRATEWFICSHLGLWAGTRNQTCCFSQRARAAIQPDVFIQIQRQQWSHNSDMLCGEFIVMDNFIFKATSPSLWKGKKSCGLTFDSNYWSTSQVSCMLIRFQPIMSLQTSSTLPVLFSAGFRFFFFLLKSATIIADQNSTMTPEHLQWIWKECCQNHQSRTYWLKAPQSLKAAFT